jgi:signal transduction histidine kinase
MIFAAKSRLFSALRASLILAGLGGAYGVYNRFEAIAGEEDYLLAVAARASALGSACAAAEKEGGKNGFLSSHLALGEAIISRNEISQVNRAAFMGIRRQYYAMLTPADYAAARERQAGASAAAGAGREAAAIAALALASARRALDARNLLLVKTALAYFSIFLVLLAAEGLQHYLVNAGFFGDLETLKTKLLHAAAPFSPTGEKRGEVEELTHAALTLDTTLENSMLARLKLGKETTLRLARMKAQTRTLELTRRKVITLVEDLEEARSDLQLEKLALKHTGEKLARSNKELEQFAYVASHDLKEPLRIVSSFSGLLSKRYAQGLDADARDFISYIDQGACRATELVNALFNYSKVTYTARDFRQVDCSLALKKAIFNLKITIDEKKASVKCGELPSVLGDEFQLIQLFQNLLSNALKFNTAPEPQILVEALGSKAEWVLRFSDNGIGIPPEHFERIFLIFQRLHTVDKYPGAGIGLALCKKIAENHGGRIWVESSPGAGSVFFVALPAQQERPAASPAGTQAEPKQKAVS